jgi:peptidoglycan/xylan/chitin deacetylase (PgdA/CDA1 family)
LAKSITTPAAGRLIVLLAILATALFASAGAARAQTVVSLTFDDGASSQYLNAGPALADYGMHGTFYVNTAFLNPRADSSTNAYYMSWSQLSQLATQGNEVGGHGLENKSLTTEVTDPEGRRHAVCDDRQNLIVNGFNPVSFAYSHGNFDAAVQSIVHACGYATARLVGGLYDSACVRCPVAESIPPRDPYAVASNSYVDGQLTADALEGYVTRAASDGGGWVPLNFHDVCNLPDCPANAVNGSISPSELRAFLGWLKSGAPPGTVVKTVQEVASNRPPAIIPHTIRPFGAPASDKVTAFASLKVRKRQDVDNIYVSAAMLEPGRLSASGTVNVPNTSRLFKLRGASKRAAPGKLVKLRLRLSRKDLRAAKRAIRAHKGVRARIKITATDKPGNRKRAKRTIRLRD